MSSAFRQSVRRTLRMKADAYMCANHLPDQSAGVLRGLRWMMRAYHCLGHEGHGQCCTRRSRRRGIVLWRKRWQGRDGLSVRPYNTAHRLSSRRAEGRPYDMLHRECYTISRIYAKN